MPRRRTAEKKEFSGHRLSRAYQRSGPLSSGTVPIHDSGEGEDAREGGGGLLVARSDGPPLLQPCPKALDAVAVDVDPGGAGHHGCLVPLAWNCRPRAKVPDVGVAGPHWVVRGEC